MNNLKRGAKILTPKVTFFTTKKYLFLHQKSSKLNNFCDFVNKIKTLLSYLHYILKNILSLNSLYFR